MREIVAEISREIVSGLSFSDVESYCRFVIAQAIEDEDMIFDEENIEDIIDPVVRDESIVDVDSIEDGDTITDYDWNNLEDDEKVVDKSGNKFVVSYNVIKPVNVVKNNQTSVIASRIFNDIESAYNKYKLSYSGMGYDFDSLFKKAGDEVHCVHCNSINVDPVWLDSEEDIYYCHDCGENFSVPVSQEDVSVETLTEEEYVLVSEPGNEIHGIIYFDATYNGYNVEIMRNGELISISECESEDEAFNLMEAFSEQYSDVEEGEILRSTETGNQMAVDRVDGDEVVIDGKQASRSNLVISKIKGKLLSDKSNVYRIAFRAGDSFRNALGDTLEIKSFDKTAGVYEFRELYTDREALATKQYDGRGNREDVAKILKDFGYVS